MDKINYPIKTRQSSLATNPKTHEGQHHKIPVSKVKPKYWVSLKETMMQSIPHPPENMAFKRWRHRKKRFDSSPSSQESFSPPESRNQQQELKNRPTFKGVEILKFTKIANVFFQRIKYQIVKHKFCGN